MGKFKFTYTEIEGVFVAEPAVFPDERGYFMETYNENDFKEEGIDLTFVQDNQSKSSKGVLRGLHFQKTQPQGKLVRVISGEVFDVAVDLRKASKTYGKWVGVRLSAENKKQFFQMDLHTALLYCQMKRNSFTNALTSTRGMTKEEFFGTTLILA